MGNIISCPELVLGYGLDEAAGQKTLIADICRQMCTPFEEILPEKTGETLGSLAKLPGFEKPSKISPDHRIQEPVLIFSGFTGKRLDKILKNLRNAGIPSTLLKAIITEHNRNWVFYELAKELIKERETMMNRKPE